MTEASTIVSRSRRSWMIQAGQYLFVALLMALMIGALTAAQISHAFLTASGGGGGISAIAIRDEAIVVDRFEEERAKEIDALGNLRLQQAAMRRTIGQASILSYAQKVQFRRFIFACYPGANVAATAAQAAPSDTQTSELSWYALLNVYREATEERARDGCDRDLADAAASPVSFYGRPGADLLGSLRPCGGGITRRARLECLWDNVTTGVWLTSAAEQARSAIDAEVIERQSYISRLEARQAERSVIANPAGRAAVAAWRQLDRGGGPLGWPSKAIALLVTFPVLVQSALLALLAGAVGGGLARIWDQLGYRRKGTRSLNQAASAVNRVVSRQPSDSDPATTARLDVLAQNLERARARVIDGDAAAQAADGAPLLTGAVSGAGSALILWLLTTSGLFVLSGGDNVASASPNVLLALSLAAGMAFRQVIRKIFEITEDYIGQREEQS